MGVKSSSIDLKNLDKELAQLSGRQPNSTITMQGLYDEIQQLKNNPSKDFAMFETEHDYIPVYVPSKYFRYNYKPSILFKVENNNKNYKMISVNYYLRVSFSCIDEFLDRPDENYFFEYIIACGLEDENSTITFNNFVVRGSLNIVNDKAEIFINPIAYDNFLLTLSSATLFFYK